MTTLLNKPLSFKVNSQHQSGAVLAISLIMLLLLTLIGVTAMQTTGLEEKMAGNLRDRNLAFQAAETALREGERETSSLPWCTSDNVAAVGGFYPYTKSDTPSEDIPKIDDDSFWLNPGKTYTYIGVILEKVTKTAQPKYIIQCINIALESEPSLYRITARGTGGTTDAVVILQSVYSRK